MAYHIQISEGQRVALVELLELYEKVHRHEVPGLDYWLTMLEELPAVEREHPGVLHGFCL